MATPAAKLMDLWKMISTRLSLQYRTTRSDRNNKWQNLMKYGCYSILLLNGLCYYQDGYNYPFFAIVVLAIVVVPFVIISHINPSNYGTYCVAVISIINLTTLDILLTAIKLHPAMLFLLFVSILFFSSLLHAKLWINGVTTMNVIFAPLLDLHILICIELCFQFIRSELYYHLLVSLLLIIFHFNNIFNGHLIGVTKDLLFFISSILFINLQSIVHIASSVYFVQNNNVNIILLIISGLHCGIICVFGVAYELCLLSLPKFNKIALPYISCILFGFGFENILIIFYCFEWYYINNTFKTTCYLFYWILFCIPCIFPFVLLWYFQTKPMYNTASSYSYAKGKRQWHPYHKWIFHDFIEESRYYPYIFNKESINIIIDRLYSIVHCAQCKFNKFNDLFSINDGNKIKWHKPFGNVCLENQRCFAKLYHVNYNTQTEKLQFIDKMLDNNFGKTSVRKYIGYIMILIVLKIISYILVLFAWSDIIGINEQQHGFAIYITKLLLIYPLLLAYIPFIIIHIYNLCIVSYYEYYFSFIWFMASRSMFVDKANVEQFCNQLHRNRIIWNQIKHKDIASILIQFLQ